MAAGGPERAERPRRRARHRARSRAGSASRHRAPRPRGRPARAVVPLALLLVLVVSGGGALRHGTGAGGAGGATDSALRSSVAGRSGPSVGGAGAAAQDARVTALQTLLDRRARGMVTRQRPEWLAGLHPATDVVAAAYAARQGEVFDRLAAVPLATWHYEYLGAGPALDAQRAAALPPGSWVAQVALDWSVTGAGRQEVRRQQFLTVVPAGSGWALAGDTDGATVPDLWDLGPVSVLRSSRSLLLGTADPQVLAACAATADAAARRVDAVWGTDWPRTTVLEVPATQAQLAQLLGRSDQDGLDQIAGVTTGELVADGATRGDHVVLNPQGFSLLAPLGRQVVLTHELTHVATRASATRAVPVWLSEGFADWVAYSGTSLPRDVVAADLLEQVRTDGPPADLPDSDDFDPTRSQVGPAYSGAWLAADLVARRSGPASLVALYRAVSSGPVPAAPSSASARTGAAGSASAQDPGERALDAALSSVLGTDRAALVRDWRASLVSLAAQDAA